MILNYFNILLSTNFLGYNINPQNHPLDLSLKNIDLEDNNNVSNEYLKTHFFTFNFEASQIRSIFFALDELYFKIKNKKNCYYIFTQTNFSYSVSAKWNKFLLKAKKILKEKKIDLKLNQSSMNILKRFCHRYNRYINLSRKKFIICYDLLKICLNNNIDHLSLYALKLYYLYPPGTLKNMSTLTNEELFLRMLFLENILKKLEISLSKIDLQIFLNVKFDKNMCINYDELFIKFINGIKIFENYGRRILTSFFNVNTNIRIENLIPLEIEDYLNEIKSFN